MGIINVTPDSFFAGSRFRDVDVIVLKSKDLLDDGADILDIGGYSSRPGADHISEEEELSRVIEPITEIKKMFPDCIISIDTFRSKVAEKALLAGADMINDISGGHLDPNMWDLLKEVKVPFVAMHMKGTPQTMKNLAQYEDLVKELISYFSIILEKANSIGLSDVIIDPGFGFSKGPNHGFELLNNLELLQILDRPILVGVSRKSMISKTLQVSPEEALNGTTVLNTLALYKGANILRVHDVKPAVEVCKLITRLRPSL